MKKLYDKMLSEVKEARSLYVYFLQQALPALFALMEQYCFVQ